MTKHADIEDSALASLDIRHGATASNTPLRLQNAGLDDRSGEIVAHGWLDLEAMRLLRVDDYQREVIGGMTVRKPAIRRAVADGARFPDIMIGMRGQRFDSPNRHDLILKDRCYIVDGLQRVAALLYHADAHPEEAKNLRIGAEVRFGTTRESEKELFQVLNTSRVSVSPNVILRNMREDSPSILTLYGLTNSDSKFPLFQRVCWNQTMTRYELSTAIMLARVAMALCNGSQRTEKAIEMPAVLDKLAKTMGLSLFRKNIVEFYDLIDKCFGIRSIHYKEVTPQLRQTFLITLARIFHDHSNFWKEGTRQLFLDARLRRKLAAFPIGDPEVVRLASAGSMAQAILYSMIVDHLNKGKTLHRLKKCP